MAAAGEAAPTGTQLSLALNLMATVMGSGLLTLPHAFACTGWLLGTILLILVACVTDLTLNYLVDIGRSSGLSSYEDNVGQLLGARGRQCVNPTLIVIFWLASAAFIVIIRDSAPPLAVALTGHQGTYYSDPNIISFAAICCIFPVCLLRDTTALQFTSGISVICLVYFVACLASEYFCSDRPWMHASVVAVRSRPRDILKCVSLLFGGYGGQANMIKMYRDMQVASRPHVRRVIHFTIFGVVTAIYICSAIMGYFLFGDSVKGDVLQDFAPSMRIQVVRGAFCLTMMCKLPLTVLPFRVSVEKCLAGLGVTLPPRLLTALLCGSVFGTAALGLDLSGCFSILGCTALPFIGTMLPCLMHMRLDASPLATPLHSDSAEKPLAPWGARCPSAVLVVVGLYAPLGAAALVLSWMGR